MLGKTDGELFGGEVADRMTQIKARVLLTGSGLRQEISRTVGGEKHFYDLTVEPVRDPPGLITGITGAAMEVTERKRLEEEILQISEMEQRRIGQDLHDGICQHLAGIELKSQSLAQTSGEESQGPGRPGRSKSPGMCATSSARRARWPAAFPVYPGSRRMVSGAPGTGRAHGEIIQRQM